MVEAGDQGTLFVETTEGTGVVEFPLESKLGEVLLLPFKTMSRISVSMGVLPTSRRKKTCSITCEETVRSEGSRSKSLPKRVG